MTDLHKASQQALEALFALRALFRDDALACSYQTLGQYQTALLRAIDCAAMAQEPAEQQEPCEPLDVLKRALEIIAVGDSKNPQQDAADALVDIGFWSGEAPQLQPKAEPALEPVAWRHKGAGHFAVTPLVSKFPEWEPLYTAPFQRKPLSEWQINDLMAGIDPEDVCSWSFRQGVYAAEKHHGVKP